MKSFLQPALIFCFHFIFAQNSKDTSENFLKQDSINLRTYHSEKNISDSLLITDQTRNITDEKTYFKIPKKTEQSVVTQNIDIVQEINAVLNYKINRIWRKDLYCLVCENFDAGRAA